MRVAASCRAWVIEPDAAHAGEEEDAMAEVLAFHQEIDGENDDDAESPYRAQKAHEELDGGLELVAIGVHDANGLGLREWLLDARIALPALAARSPLMSSTAVNAFSRDCSAGEWTEAIFFWMLRR